MRTKTLLVAGAISALALTASLAQSVYSVNVVGYVNVAVGAGYNCIANPLDASPDNKINSVIPATADGTYILKWDPVAQSFGQPQQYYDGYGWADETGALTSATIEPGEGFFINCPAATNITFVGDVRQGNLSKTIYAGYNCLAQLSPQSGDIMNFGYPAVDGDYVLYFDNASGSYSQPIQYYDGYGWADQSAALTPPVVNVGRGIMMNAGAGHPAWNYTFQIQ